MIATELDSQLNNNSYIALGALLGGNISIEILSGSWRGKLRSFQALDKILVKKRFEAFKIPLIFDAKPKLIATLQVIKGQLLAF